MFINFIYHAVDFTDYYLCTKFVVSCHRNLNFPLLFFNWTDLHDIYMGYRTSMELLDTHQKKGKKGKKRAKFEIL
jgi:hypothetical protein